MNIDEEFVTEEPEVVANEKQYLPCEACTEFFEGLEESGIKDLDSKELIKKAGELRHADMKMSWKDAVKNAAKSMQKPIPKEVPPEEKKPEEEKCKPKPEEEKASEKPVVPEVKNEDQSVKVLNEIKSLIESLKKEPEAKPEVNKELEQKLSEKDKQIQTLKEEFESFKNQGFKVTRQELSNKKEVTLLTGKDGSVCQDINEYCRWR